MKVSTESMSASASSSFAAGTAAAAAAITGRLTVKCRDAAVRAPPLRWFLPKDAHGGSVCDDGVGEEEVEGRKLGEARARSISASAVGMLCFFQRSGGVWLVLFQFQQRNGNAYAMDV
jgi:hypothetical protein